MQHCNVLLPGTNFTKRKYGHSDIRSIERSTAPMGSHQAGAHRDRDNEQPRNLLVGLFDDSQHTVDFAGDTDYLFVAGRSVAGN